VAAQLSVEYADRLWVLKIGYDERWSRCSPGWQLLAETMRDAFDRRLRSYEFLGSDEPWLHGWKTQSRELDTVAWLPGHCLKDLWSRRRYRRQGEDQGAVVVQ
jgi:hypothetical protein